MSRGCEEGNAPAGGDVADHLRLLVESQPDYAIFLLDPSGHVVTWNGGARRLKGYVADEIIGRPVLVLIPPPFPFTPVIMTASALQCSRQKLFGAVFVGRLVRYTVEAILALYFGRQVIAYFNSDVVSYIVYGLVALGVVLSTFSLLRWLKRS